MQFIKMHGTGNDFILFVIPNKKQVFFNRLLIKKLCDRHFGIGADGVILVLPARPVRSEHGQGNKLLSNFNYSRRNTSNGARHKKTDFRMRIFNADGNEAEMCGNGIRCLGKLVYDYRLTRKKELLIETLSGPIYIKLFTKNNYVEKVTVNIPNQPKITPLPYSGFKNILGNKKYTIIRVLLGNPHCVIFIPNDINKFPIEKYGPLLERHRLFPQRTNVEFVRIQSKSSIKMRVWERGVGETLACGTGACASVVAGIAANKLKPHNVKVNLPGGNLIVSWEKSLGLSLTGPTEMVFEGTI